MDELDTILEQMRKTGELPANISDDSLKEMSKSLKRYFGDLGKLKIKEFTDKAKSIAEAAMKVTETAPISLPEAPHGVSKAGETATQRGLLEDFLTQHGAKNIADTMNLEFFLRIPEQLSMGAGKFIRGNADPDMVEMFPGMEFSRVYDRDVPRGSPKDPAGPDNAWDDGEGRWAAACEEAGDDKALEVFQDTGRCVALKSSGVWQALGDGAGGYDDCLGCPFPPFAFNSGWETTELPRSDCEELGLMEPEDGVEGPDVDFGDLLGLDGSNRVVQLGALHVLGSRNTTLANGAQNRAIYAYSPDQPRDSHGRFGSGGILPAPEFKELGTIHGHSVVSVVRRLAKEGYTKDQIRNVVNSHNIPISEGTLSKNFRSGQLGQGSQAPLTTEHLAETEKRKDYNGPRPISEPPIKLAPREPKEPKTEKEWTKESGLPDPVDRYVAKDKLVLSNSDLKGYNSVTHEQAVATLHSRIGQGTPMTAEQQAEFKQSISNACQPYHPQGLRRILQNTNTVKMLQLKDFNREFGTRGASGRYAGFYASHKGLIVTDHPGNTSTMTHELGHALDKKVEDDPFTLRSSQPRGRRARHSQATYFFSQTDEFKKAWRADKPNVRPYGQQSPLEGFACSVQHAGDYGKADLAKNCPNIARYMDKHKILK